jgi:hypothetical protein
MNMNDPIIADLWHQARAQLPGQLERRTLDAVFLEGSIAEGFGNERSDVDFVAIIDDGSPLATMPYILFAGGRRIEVRLLSSRKLRHELGLVRAAAQRGRRSVARLSWNLLERCQRFMGAASIHNAALIAALQAQLGREALGNAVSLWFEDFACQSGRYAVAMLGLDQPDYARAWINTAVFHAAKSHVARLGEFYLSPKWLSLQLQRADVESDRVRRFWDFLHADRDVASAAEHVDNGIALLREFNVSGVSLTPEKVLIGAQRGVTTWQIGARLHILRDSDVFALDDEAARVWRGIQYGSSCMSIADAKGGAVSPARRRELLANFSRAGLIALQWKGAGAIRARLHATSAPVTNAPIITTDGARLVADGAADMQLLPMPARRFVEAGIEKVWGNIGLENGREDALGALKRGQWQVLEYALQRMIQTACMVALGAHGVTPLPPMEECTLEAIRLLRLESDLTERIRQIERCSISTQDEAVREFQRAEEAAQTLRVIGGESQFPASFDTESGWRATLLAGYDWINLGAHLNVRFPQTAHGGRGTAEEARDLLASCA